MRGVRTLHACHSLILKALLMFFVSLLPRFTLPAILSLSCAMPASAAPAEAPPIQSVAISASRDAANSRQDDSSMRTVFGQEELQKYADSTLSEVLKRLPGVSVTDTPGKGLQIRMRGLGNGYTQILLNGEATPAGYALDSIAPELIARIEVIRAAGADISAQGIAGSINIVLKKKTEKKQREFKLGLAEQDAQWSPNFSLNLSDKNGALAYLLVVAAEASRRDTSEIFHESQARLQDGVEQPIAARQLQEHTQRRKDSLSLSPRLNWQINPAQSLAWQSFVSRAQFENKVLEHEQEHENKELGASTNFPMNNSVWAARATIWRNDWTWETRLADSAKLAVTAGWNYFKRDSQFNFWGRDAKATLLTHRFVQADADEKESKFNGKYLVPYIEHHVLSLGWESSRSQRHELRFEREALTSQVHKPDDLHLYDASLSKLALFAQDEWSLRPDLSAYLGLRWERIQSHSSEPGVYALENSVSMFSPNLQTVWKLADKKQIRFALNRSFKAPLMLNLIPRLFRIDNNNNPLNPDRQGNPNLRPEKAWGGDLAYEAYLPQGGVLSASICLRKISDLNREILTQRGNSWLTTPVNDGTGLSRGIELEAKFDLQQLAASLPKLGVRASLARNWSSVDKVPAPDNRIAEQIALSANLGLDYQLNPQVNLGGDFTFQGAAAMRSSAYLSTQNSPKRQLDLYASWHLGSQSQLRFSVNNLLKHSSMENDLYQDAQQRWRALSNTPGQTLWRCVWEQRF